MDAQFNAFTLSSGQSKISRKILNFTFSNPAKQIVSCKRTAEEVSFEWSHHRISSTDSKVRTTLNVSITDSGSTRVKAVFAIYDINVSCQIKYPFTHNCIGLIDYFGLVAKQCKVYCLG